MHRRPLGSGRRLAVVGAVLLLLGAFLPWYTAGGGEGQFPATVVNALNSGSGVLAVLAALATLALVTLPYATEGRPIPVDRGVAYGLLVALALVGAAAWLLPGSWVWDLPQGLLPDRAYGFWITVVGVIVLGRAAFDISREPPVR